MNLEAERNNRVLARGREGRGGGRAEGGAEGKIGTGRIRRRGIRERGRPEGVRKEGGPEGCRSLLGDIGRRGSTTAAKRRSLPPLKKYFNAKNLIFDDLERDLAWGDCYDLLLAWSSYLFNHTVKYL